MRAIVCKEFGSLENLVFEERPTLLPGRGEIAIAVRAVGVNYTDVLAIEGRSQLKRNPPIVPGVELSGVVRAVGGGVSGLAPGQRVLASCIHGAYAEEVCVKADEACVIPDTMDFNTAAVFYIASFTAYYALVTRAKLTPGETLLVLGAGSGAGLAAVEIGKAIGARVVAAASSDEKLALARHSGADAMVKYPLEPLDLAAQKKFCAELKSAAGSTGAALGIGRLSTLGEGGSYDVIYDAVGGTYTEPALRALGWEGRYLFVGFAAGPPSVGLASALFKNADIMGIQPAADEYRMPGRNRAAVDTLFGWYEEDKLRPQITGTYPLARAADALLELKERRAKGRIVLVTRE